MAALVERPSLDGNRYWDDPTSTLDANGLRLKLIGDFDWDDFSARTLQYLRVRIEASRQHAHLVGREALVEPNDVRLLYEG